MNVLSLFDGMSCGQIALNRAGIKYDNYFASEIDKWAIKVTQHNYPKTIQLGNIIELKSESLPKIDLLFGGSPCQSFSSAGRGEGFNGKSGLFWEFVRILKETNPTYFLLENVKMKKEWEDIITNEMGVEPIKINSHLVSAQNRIRLYWTNIPNISQPEDRGIVVKDIVEDQVDDEFYLSEKALEKIARNSFAKKFETITTEKTKTLIAGYYKTPGGGIYFQDSVGKRRYTPTECERLQTVTEGYTSSVSKTQRYKMLGNGWTVDVIAHIFNSLPKDWK